MSAVPTFLASAPVTDWPERIVLTLGVVALIGVVLVLMRWGWVRRGRRQSDIAALPPVPELPAAPGMGAVPARYLGATRAGDWLDRVVVNGLGVPSAAQVTVDPEGVWVLRSGAPDIFVASGEVVGVRHDRGIAGRVFESDGVLVITWRHGDQLVDLGLRVREPLAAESLRAAIASLASTPPLSTEPSLSTTPFGDLA